MNNGSHSRNSYPADKMFPVQRRKRHNMRILIKMGLLDKRQGGTKFEKHFHTKKCRN